MRPELEAGAFSKLKLQMSRRGRVPHQELVCTGSRDWNKQYSRGHLACQVQLPKSSCRA